MNKSEEMLEILRKGAGLPEGAEIIKVDNDNCFPIIITYKLENITSILKILSIKKEKNIYETTKFGRQKYIRTVLEDTPLSTALDEIKKLIGVKDINRHNFKYDKETGWTVEGFLM